MRAIIHGLRMSGFSFVGDDEAREKVIFMIGELPTPETLDSMVMAPEGLKDVKEQIGQIMRLIEEGGRRDENFKVRFEAKKDIPPRYKVLKWRTAMNKKDLTKLRDMLYTVKMNFNRDPKLNKCREQIQTLERVLSHSLYFTSEM